MKIIRDLDELNSINIPTAVALGKFDGVHLGHRRILAEVLGQNETSAVLTFDPLPEVCFGSGDGKKLLTAAEKEALLEKLGINILVYFPLNKKSAAMEAEAFVRDVLRGRLKMAFICAGDDVRFGAGGRGDGALLEALAQGAGFRAKLIPKLRFGEREISSTYVREAVVAGDMPLAECLLGDFFLLGGRVAEGAKLGRRLGFPTVNIYPPAEKILPPYGVYFSKVSCRQGEFQGITNIGVKPTVSDVGRVAAETYIYDFDGDLYDEQITVRLAKFHRPERKFANIAELKAQVEADIAILVKSM
jgi:riboflavin kinase/FMN adenylyltransferase